MKLSKRAFSLKFNFESQWLRVLCKRSIIHSYKIGKRDFIDDGVWLFLKKGVHYVECPHCGKKMASITKKHYKSCGGVPGKNEYCELYKESHTKTDSQKNRQSRILKARFQTAEGQITRELIGKESRRINSNPDFLARKRKICKEVQNRPEMREMHRKKSKEMWASKLFRDKRMKQIDKDIENLRAMVSRARSFLKKTSSLHLNYKKAMLEKGLKGFISEYAFGPYSIDEADPFAKIALEIDGCYWHGCTTCGYPGDPKIHVIDKKKATYLKNRGWVIFRVREHELKKDPYVAIEMIRNIQEKRTQQFKTILKNSFFKGSLLVRSMVNKEDSPQWVPVKDIVRHFTPRKKMLKITTEIGSALVTEDHSLFKGINRTPISTSELKIGDTIVGLSPQNVFEPARVLNIEEAPSEKFTYDLSVPQAENFVLDSGILAHNTYSISGVSLDIDKSSKYMSIKDEFINEYDKIVEANKRSIKIIKGLRQFRYGVGITSALGPLSRPGIQSRRNMVEAGSVGTWS
jgi:very-short-patch-repair endonuclease